MFVFSTEANLTLKFDMSLVQIDHLWKVYI